jgi:hypothetical protein
MIKISVPSKIMKMTQATKTLLNDTFMKAPLKVIFLAISSEDQVAEWSVHPAWSSLPLGSPAAL